MGQIPSGNSTWSNHQLNLLKWMQNFEAKQKKFGIRLLSNDYKHNFSYIVLITDLKIQNSDIYPNLRYVRTCKMLTPSNRKFYLSIYRKCSKLSILKNM